MINAVGLKVKCLQPFLETTEAQMNTFRVLNYL